MRPIPFSVVERTYNEMSRFGFDKIKRVINKMGKEQPYLLTYLLATGDREFNQAERELFVYLGVGIWCTMTYGDKPLPMVLPVLIDEIEKDNLKMLDSLEKMDEEAFVKYVEKIIENYPQPELLFYVVNALIEEQEIEIGPDKIGVMFVYLKIVMDAFQKASEMNSVNKYDEHSEE